MKRIYTLILGIVVAVAASAQVTFEVDKNLPEVERRGLLRVDGQRLWREWLTESGAMKVSKGVLASSVTDSVGLINGRDVLYQTIVKAYAEHRPLVLSPDVIWLNICQVFGHYVSENVATMRDVLVNHSDKKNLVVTVEDSFKLEQADWNMVVEKFSQHIADNTKGDIAATMLADFSTTTAVERVASSVTLMDALHPYFNYTILRIACGIPSITLTGTADDWRRVLAKTEALENYHMAWFTADLKPILCEFVKAAEGKADRRFWQSMVKKHRPDKLKGRACSAESPTTFDGWFTKMFPYAKSGERAKAHTNMSSMMNSMSMAEVRYVEVDVGKSAETMLELWAGIVGVDEDVQTGALAPRIGWMVRKAEGMNPSVKGAEALSSSRREWGDWKTWGAVGESAWINPIIPSDYSDIDCIGVDDEFYAISSTFQFSPGMTIMRSRDLMNWEIVGGAVPDLTQISKELDYTRMNRYARGIWAGTLRHHNGRFYLFFGTPDEGFFMTSAEKAEGPWEPLTCMLAESGWDDCTAFWDEETGKAWFVGTHFADNYKTYMFPMSADGKSIDRSKAMLINEGSGREANKLLKRGDWYYLVFSEHKNGVGRYVMAKRTRRLEDGFSEEKQLAVASTEANEPNQGGLVDHYGRWFFLTHHGTGDWSGRVVSLLPVKWVDDWPIIGKVRPDGMGEMAWSGSTGFSTVVKRKMQRSDDFDSGKIEPQWQWNYQPRQSHFSLTERSGWLRLKAFKPIEPGKLLKAGNTLTARVFRTSSSKVEIKIDVSGMTDGMRCGLCHFSASSSSLGIEKRDGKKYVTFRENDEAKSSVPVPDGISELWLRSEWGLDGMSHYSYSLDGVTFTAAGDYQLRWGNYRGDRYGIFCYNDKEESGYVDVDYCHYDMK